MFYRFLDHFEASYTKRILVESVELLDQLWFYLVLGILLSTIIKEFISKRQLADLGMSQGAVLAYFISGPATKISNLVVLQATFKGVMHPVPYHRIGGGCGLRNRL